MTSARITLESLSSSSETRFVRLLGGIFEDSPWVAAAAWASRPFASAESLHEAMVHVVRDADRALQLALIRAHPQLAGQEAREGGLSANSTDEQSRAGLNQCTAQELGELKRLNADYLAKFGFPFVMAVKDRTQQEILIALAQRIGNQHEVEFERCLDEIAKIARFRLLAMLGRDQK